MAIPTPPSGEITLRGIAGSPGVGHGKAFVFIQSELAVPTYEVRKEDSAQEIARFERGLVATRHQISQIRQEIAGKLGEDEARIFDAHQLVLEDKALIEEVIREQAKTNFNIETCFKTVAQRYIDFFETIEDEYLKERVADIRDVTRRLLNNLLGQQEAGVLRLGEGRVLVSHDLSPSETAGLEKHKVLGFITETGGSTSHAVIMARSLQIPAVVGVQKATDFISSEDEVLIDGYDGIIYVRPSEPTLFRYGKIQRRRRSLQDRFNQTIGLPPLTTDGRELILRANIDSANELDNVLRVKARGVGLFRTEGLFLRDNDFPSEDRQFEEYRKVVSALAPRAVVIRTLDLGGDKNLRGMFQGDEGNPFMGFRAIRFCLQHPGIFKEQLRAILRASAFGQVRLMYPMISGLPELLEAKQILAEARQELDQRGQAYDPKMQVGSMIEIPSAAFTSDLLAEHCDFFSIGTNDLIQYMVAADRMNERIAHLFDASHPAVLRAIKTTIDAARRKGITVSICGEMAGMARYTALLIGLGATELSLSAPVVPEINFLIRMLEARSCHLLAEEVMTLSNPEKITLLLNSFYQSLLSEIPESGN